MGKNESTRDPPSDVGLGGTADHGGRGRRRLPEQLRADHQGRRVSRWPARAFGGVGPAGIGRDGRRGWSPLPAVADGRPVAAYYVRHPGARGVLLVCGGERQTRSTSPSRDSPGGRRLAGLDLAVFSYYQEGEPVPSVAAVRGQDAGGLRGRGGPGHAGGGGGVRARAQQRRGGFAMDLAAAEPVRGLVLVGAETTPADVIHLTYGPVQPPGRDPPRRRRAAAGRGPVRARRSGCRRWVVTSTGDADVPARDRPAACTGCCRPARPSSWPCSTASRTAGTSSATPSGGPFAEWAR